MEVERYDLIVVGGGPGGSTVSALVAAKGHRVLLLEKEMFPRHQIGESLLPSTIQVICPLLGVKEEVDNASFIPKKGGTFLWGKSSSPWRFYFDYTAGPETAKALSYQVERAKFDNILLNNAKRKGVEVKHNCVVTEVLEEGDRVVGVKYQDEKGNLISAYSRYVADASGYGSRICSTVGERVFSKHFNNIAIYGYFEKGKRLPAPDEGSILCVAFNQGWLWYIPLSDNLTSVGIVIDKNQEPNIHSRKEEIFDKYVRSARLMDEYLGSAVRCTDERYGKLRVRHDYSYTTTRLWKPGLVLIGDAGCFIDPVFSSGVHLSTFSALLAARSINSTLLGIADETKCFNEFEKRYRKEFANFYNFLIAFYDMEQTEESYFWTAKRVIQSPEKSNVAFIKLISGFSTGNLESEETAENFFEGRSSFGESFSHLVNSTATKEDPPAVESEQQEKITLDNFAVEDEKFMMMIGDVLQSNLVLEADSHEKRGALKTSKDSLCWEEAST